MHIATHSLQHLTVWPVEKGKCERRHQNNTHTINPFTYHEDEHLVKPVNRDGRWKQRYQRDRAANWHHNSNKGYTKMLTPEVDEQRKNCQLAAARAARMKKLQRRWVPCCRCMPHRVSVNCRKNFILNIPKEHRSGKALQAAGSVIPVKWRQGFVAGGRPQEPYRVHNISSESEPEG